MLKSLGLNDLDDEGIPYRTPYNFRLTSPVSIPENSQFYGIYEIKLKKGNWSSDDESSVSSEDKGDIIFNLNGQSVRVDFNEIVQSTELTGGYDPDKPILTKPIRLETINGNTVQLLILEGYVAVYRDRDEKDGNFEIAFVVPN